METTPDTTEDGAERDAAAAQLEQLARARSAPIAPAPKLAAESSTPALPRAPKPARTAAGRMKPGSVRWNRENARRARAGLPQLGAGDTAADAPNAPNRPGAPATARRATPRRDNTAALRAVQAQSGPVSSLPNDSAKRAARLAASQDANTVGMLAGGLAQAVSLGFGMLARTRGEHWAITESDAAALGTAWAPVAAYYGGDMDPLTMLWVGAITGTVAVVAPRIVADVEAQRGGRARQVPNVSSPAPHAPAAPPVNVPHVVVDDVPPGMARAPYTGSGAP